jgi:hypothetical protein
MQFPECHPMFRSNIVPPASRFKYKQNKKSNEAGSKQKYWFIPGFLLGILFSNEEGDEIFPRNIT